MDAVSSVEMTSGPPGPPPPFLDAVRALRRGFPEPPPRYRLPLTVNTFEEEEIAAALEALVRGPLTMGPRVAAFEAEFAAAHGAPAAVFCNSGSSANLLAVSALTRPLGGDGPALAPGDEVIVPALTWSTTVWPVVQAGAVPVLADVSPGTLALTLESVERALSARTRAVFAAHILGNPAPVAEIAALCARRRLTLLEDACEALDAEIDGRKAGTFGRMGTFSFYFSHHLCTIEGGMVLCADGADAANLRILRAHGWIRDLPEPDRRAAAARHPDIDPRFLFVDTGYNLRGTEVQAAIGRVQFARRLGFRERRRQAAASWSAALDRHRDLFEPVRFSDGANPFAFPLVLRREAPASRGALARHLEERGIETRPVLAGNLARQPALAGLRHRVAGPLPGADLVHERGLYVGLHPGLTEDDLAVLPEAIEGFARGEAGGTR
jgi:CDP-6-deoxy-D-xylo-4-hexulose-3-dehydrase